MAARKTLYVRNELLWDAASRVSGQSLSSLVEQLLADYLRRHGDEVG